MKEILVRYRQCQNMDRLIQLELLMSVEAHLLVEQASIYKKHAEFVFSDEFLHCCIILIFLHLSIDDSMEPLSFFTQML